MHTLLLSLHRCARLLRPLKLPLIVFTLCALLLTSYCLVFSSGRALDLLEPAIVASLWGMLLLASMELFQNKPVTVQARTSFWHSVKLRLQLLLYMLLALITCVVFASLIWLSLRLLLI